MASNKPKFERFVTPAGVAIWPRLLEPDTKFDSKGVYHTKLAIPAEEAAEFRAKLEAALSKAVTEFNAEEGGKKKYAKYSTADICEEEVNDEGEETGRLIFRFKRPAGYQKKDSDTVEPIRAPALFDAMNRDVSSSVESIFGGTVMKIAGHIRPYALASAKSFGLSLRIDGVQIIDLKSRSGPDAEYLGFGKVEGGYSAGGSTVSTGSSESDDADDATDGEDSDEF